MLSTSKLCYLNCPMSVPVELGIKMFRSQKVYFFKAQVYRFRLLGGKKQNKNSSKKCKVYMGTDCFKMFVDEIFLEYGVKATIWKIMRMIESHYSCNHGMTFLSEYVKLY